MTTMSQIVVITGGANGIGAQVARRRVEPDAPVALLDRDADQTAQVADWLGNRAAAFGADAGIAGPAATVAAVDPVLARHRLLGNAVEINAVEIADQRISERLFA